MIRPWLKKTLYNRLIRRIEENRECQNHATQEKASAIVFSPHFDDETLGCGGTIIKKVKAGADVRIVFMTDGSTSHRHLISEERLRGMRSAEGVNAAFTLGLKPEDVTLLGFKEGRLESHRADAVKRVAGLIAEHGPDEVFVPHRREPLLWSEDHLETRRVVLEALNVSGKKPVIVEFPVWYWFHWPWVGIRLGDQAYRNIILKNTIAHTCGLGMKKDFNCSVAIADVLEEKIKALEQHKSQVSRIMPDKKWTTLADISDGEFVQCFFRDYETFMSYKLQG